jgi:hypothetical protein
MRVLSSSKGLSLSELCRRKQMVSSFAGSLFLNVTPLLGTTQSDVLSKPPPSGLYVMYPPSDGGFPGAEQKIPGDAA